jgi:hypothetical protein
MMLPISDFASCPPFVKVIACADNPELVNSIDIDFWAVEPFGDPDTDRAVGEIYAELAVMYARTVKKPDFITVVLAFIHGKARDGLLPAGSEAIADGFYARIARLAYVGSLN